ncbi:MAG: methionine biosynthesis protein MetW, partial [Planctomycetota bacterium]
SVLDLGCGDGLLLERLQREGAARVQGLELEPEAVLRCIERHVPVIQHDLDDGLPGFEDSTWDVVICEETLQALRRPVAVLQEILRVGRRGIVTFPNFAHWRMRMDLFLHGRMPVTPSYPHHWYDSPNIHPITLADFQDWAQEAHIHIALAYAYAAGSIRPLNGDDNLHAEQVLLVIER